MNNKDLEMDYLEKLQGMPSLELYKSSKSLQLPWEKLYLTFGFPKDSVLWLSSLLVA